MTTGQPTTLDHVLVATDFSPGAGIAVSRATALPLRHGAMLALLHVVPEPVPARLRDVVRERAKAALKEQATDARRALDERGRGDVRIAHEVVLGTPFVDIIRYARTHAADLVVVGRQGHSPVRDAFVGSTAERVVRKGDIPVLLAKQSAASAYERALVGLDLSDGSTRVLDLALTLLPQSVRVLRMVHAYHVAFEGWLGPDTLAQVRRERDEYATATARSIAAPYEEGGTRCHLVVREGDPRTVLLGEIVRQRCDLVVVGTHARSGVAHALVGSVAEWIIRMAPCDVAVTRPVPYTFQLP